LRRTFLKGDGGPAYEEFIARLDAAKIAAQALQPGDAMPAFLLPNAEGELVDSAELLAAGPIVVSFFRGGWCPYCSATLDAMQAVLSEVTAAGATFVAMTPETGGRALATKRAHGLHYQVLADVDLAIAMAFGIVFRTPPLYEALLRRTGVDLAERTGNPAWLMPLPATFLVRRDGVIARSWVDIDFTRRAEPADIVAALKAL
jgi:peroxiredoxin